VSKPSQLAALLVEMGVSGDVADDAAKRFWRERPADAAVGVARIGEAVWRGTGLRAWQAGGLLAAFIVAWLLVVLALH
jgi:hypothetical protein